MLHQRHLYLLSLTMTSPPPPPPPTMSRLTSTTSSLTSPSLATSPTDAKVSKPNLAQCVKSNALLPINDVK
ncbi:hypothetical protein ACFX19_033119 [Malus domestica]